MTLIGEGDWIYQVVDGWGDLPAEWGVRDVAGVSVDAQDRVYVFNRSKRPMIVLNPDGSVADVWPRGEFEHPHGVHIGPDGTVYCADDGAHTVTLHASDGRLLMRIGMPARPSGFHSGLPFNRCTHTALSPEGAIYVTDGYHNHRVHKFSPDGKLLLSWGESGVGPGQFNFPHAVVTDRHGWVYVADRENHRIQVFDGDGRFEVAWGNLHRPSALFLKPESGDGDSEEQRFFVGEIGPVMRFSRGAPNLGPRLSVLNGKGEVTARVGTEPAAGVGPGQFLSPHGMAVDSQGNLYVAEVSATAWPQLFPGVVTPEPLRCLQKLVPINQH